MLLNIVTVTINGCNFFVPIAKKFFADQKFLNGVKFWRLINF